MTKKTTLLNKKPVRPSKVAATKPSLQKKKSQAASKATPSTKTPKKAEVSKKQSTTASTKSAPKKLHSKTVTTPRTRGALEQLFISPPPKKKKQKLAPFLQKQQQRLLQLKDMLLDSMSGVAQGHLHEGSDTSAFGMHQADAGSDAYDRDFALSIISQEQNSLYEIDEALKRIDDGSYGICELCNKPIPHARLEARPFTRYTVGCQAELEKRQHVSGVRLPVSALFGVTEEEIEHDEEEEGLQDTHKE